MPPKSKRNASKYAEDDDFVVADDAEPDTKRAKTKAKPTVAQKETGKKFTDEEGNPYWELGGRLRRVTVSKFKGKPFVNIREHYEKDGKVLPGKKGISLNIEQFDALISALPQLEVALAEQDIELSRPAYITTAASRAQTEDTSDKGEQ